MNKLFAILVFSFLIMTILFCIEAVDNQKSKRELELTQDSLRVERSHVRLLEANMKIINKNRYNK